MEGKINFFVGRHDQPSKSSAPTNTSSQFERGPTNRSADRSDRPKQQQQQQQQQQQKRNQKPSRGRTPNSNCRMLRQRNEGRCVCVCVCVYRFGTDIFFCCAVFQVRRRPPTPVGRRAAAAHEYADASANGRGAVAVHNRWLRFSRNTKQNAFLKADTVIESLTLTSRYLLTHLSGLSCFVCFSSLDR